MSYRISHGHWKSRSPFVPTPSMPLVLLSTHSVCIAIFDIPACLPAGRPLDVHTPHSFRWEINQYRSHSRILPETFHKTDSLCERAHFSWERDRFNGPARPQAKPFRYNNVSICCVLFFNDDFFFLSFSIFFLLLLPLLLLNGTIAMRVSVAACEVWDMRVGTQANAFYCCILAIMWIANII